jgi:hypothetical protein
MRSTRRFFLRALARSAALLGFGWISAGSAAADTSVASKERTLAAYLDTLIPDDDLGPGVVRLGIDKKFLAAAAADQRRRALLDAGLAWLDEQAKWGGAQDFVALGEAGRATVVSLAAEAEPGSLPRKFFEATRSGALTYYYSHPQAWAAIGYDGPPQPAGFTDYTDPPKPRQ